MADWMYAHSLPVEEHPAGCTCGGCYASTPDIDSDSVDTAPICLACGWPMEWSGDEDEIEFDGGTVYEPVYRCCNPDCNDEEGH